MWRPHGGRVPGLPHWLAISLPGVAVALLIFVVLVGSGLALGAWLRLQTTTARLAESQANALATRATAAETRAVAAEASLTAIAREQTARLAVQAQASATAVAANEDPERTVERGLDLVLKAYQEPSEARVAELGRVFSANALAVFQPELDLLRSQGRRLAGEAGKTMEVLGVDRPEATRADVRTNERWVYDEHNASGERVRCVAEVSTQTYLLRWGGQGWMVEGVELTGVERTGC